jgi:hypothetical protein
LDAAETSDAIDRLIEEIASQRKQSSILSLPQGAREFADAFVAANSPSDAQYLALAKAFYGDNPQVKISAIDPQAAQLDVALSRIDPQSILRKLCSVYSVADISLIPEGTKDTDFSQKWQHASSDSRNGYGEYSWGALGSYYSLHLAAPPGRYVARVVIDVGMVANAGVTPWGWPGPPSRWGNTKAHWVETFHTPIQVPAPIQRGADGRPTTTLVTDAALDPQKTGTITAKAAALCYPDGTEIYVTLDYSHILVPLFAKSALLIDGRRYESGLIDFILAAHQTGLMIDIGALPKSVTSCKVSLVPDVTFAHSCGYDRCWGKPIELEDVPIMHMERTGTFAGYLEWKRDAIAKAVAATKKPAQPATQK